MKMCFETPNEFYILSIEGEPAIIPKQGVYT